MRIILSNYFEDAEKKYSDKDVADYINDSYNQSVIEYVAEYMAIEVEDVEQDDIDEVFNELRELWVDDNIQDMTEQLFQFFDNQTVLFVGTVGLWDGNFSGGAIGDFKELFYKALKDCGYYRVYEDKEHMFVEGTHHDGTNSFEVKVLTEKGEDYYEGWYYGTNKRLENLTEQQVHKNIYESYSKLPHFCKYY